MYSTKISLFVSICPILARVTFSAKEESRLLHFQPFTESHFHFYIILGCAKMGQMRVYTLEITLKNKGTYYNK